MENTEIEWAHHTFNPWWGCTHVSPACANCYADRDSRRFGFDIFGADKERRFFGDEHWKKPVHWNKRAGTLGEYHRVFCASMGDVFEDRRDLDEWRARLWPLIEETPNLDWLLLTKRPENMRAMAPWAEKWPSNAWAMTTAENQEWMEARWAHLRLVPARVFGLSVEPMLGEIDLRPVLANKPAGTELWVIAGGESGPKVRPTPTEWFQSLRDQCVTAGIPFFFKQVGVMPATATTKRLSKEKAGRELDGRTWDEFPRCGIGI